MEVISLCRPFATAPALAYAMSPVIDFADTKARTAMAGGGGTDRDAAVLDTPQQQKQRRAREKAEEASKRGAGVPQRGLIDEDGFVANLLRLESGFIPLNSGPLPASAVEQIRMTQVLEHPVTLEIFKDHLTNARHDEILVAWQTIQRFKTMRGPNARTAMAASIVDSYFRAGAPRALNVAHTLSQKYEQAVKNSEHRPDLFDESAVELLQLLQTNSWSSFVESPSYRVCCVVLQHPSFMLNSSAGGGGGGGGSSNVQLNTNAPLQIQSVVSNDHKYQPEKKAPGAQTPIRGGGAMFALHPNAPTAGLNAPTGIGRNSPIRTSVNPHAIVTKPPLPAGVDRKSLDAGSTQMAAINSGRLSTTINTGTGTNGTATATGTGTGGLSSPSNAAATQSVKTLRSHHSSAGAGTLVVPGTTASNGSPAIAAVSTGTNSATATPGMPASAAIGATTITTDASPQPAVDQIAVVTTTTN